MKLHRIAKLLLLSFVVASAVYAETSHNNQNVNNNGTIIPNNNNKVARNTHNIARSIYPAGGGLYYASGYNAGYGNGGNAYGSAGNYGGYGGGSGYGGTSYAPGASGYGKTAASYGSSNGYGNQAYGGNYGSSAGYGANYYGSEVVYAEAMLRGYSVVDKALNLDTAVFRFKQTPFGLEINGLLCNLNKNTYYAFYVHEFGEHNAGCESAGLQYTRPGGYGPRGGPPTGYIGLVKLVSGSKAPFYLLVKHLQLSEIIGRSVVVHEVTLNDQSPRGNAATAGSALEISQPGVQADVQVKRGISDLYAGVYKHWAQYNHNNIQGRRISCGVIGRGNPTTWTQPLDTCEVVIAPEVVDNNDSPLPAQNQ